MVPKHALAWMIIAGLPWVSAAMAQSSAQNGLSLEQAVMQVQQRVGGKVLSAEPLRLGRRVEYRIKVLTPDGHVQVIIEPADATHPPAAAQSTKKSPNGGSNKEKH